MKISKIPQRFETGINRMKNTTFWIAGIMGFAMMFLVALDVLGRITIKRPIFGTQELCQMVVFFMTLLAIANTQARQEHVCIDIVYTSYFPQRLKNVADAVTSFLGMALIPIVMWSLIDFGIMSWVRGETTDLFEFPVGLFRLLGGFLGVFLFLEFVLEFKDACQRLRG